MPFRGMEGHSSDKIRKTSLREVLRGDFAKRGETELRLDIDGLFDTLTGYELVEAVIGQVKRYALEVSDKAMVRDFSQLASYILDQIKEKIREKLIGYISDFLSDAHQEFIVSCHAQGLSTADAIVELMVTDKTINRLVREDAIGLLKLRQSYGTRSVSTTFNVY